LVHISDIITLKDLFSLTHYISLFLTVSVSSGTSVSLSVFEESENDSLFPTATLSPYFSCLLPIPSVFFIPLHFHSLADLAVSVPVKSRAQALSGTWCAGGTDGTCTLTMKAGQKMSHL